MAKANLFPLILICIPLSFNVAFGGSIEFDEVLSFSVPGLETIRNFEFADADFDGYYDILAGDSRNVVVYSYQKDSILFSYDLNSLIDLDVPNYYDIVFSDINRDAYPDVVIGACDYYGAETHLMFYSGKGFWGEVDSFMTTVSGGDPCPSDPPIRLFDAIDFDHDGYTEFAYSLQFCDSQPLYLSEWSYGFLSIYHSYPDSIQYQNGLVYTDNVVKFPQPYSDFTAIFTYAYGYSWKPGGYSSMTEGGGYRIFNGFEEYGAPFPGFAALDQPSCDRDYEWEIYGPLCVGNIDTTTYGMEILTYLDHWYCCNETAVPACTSESYTELYQFEEPNTLRKLWRIAHIPKMLFYLADNPGSFYALDTDSIRQYDGRDGSLMGSFPHSMVGIRRWDHTFYDRHEFLVTTHENNVVIYQADVVTDADDEYQPPLPATLSLGKPYPNPFNAEQTIPVTTTAGSHLTVDVYDILGRKVERIYDNRTDQNEIRLIWNSSAHVSGIYFVKATCDGSSAVVKSILIK